jgi:ActR/RegA family two-component response regulator
MAISGSLKDVSVADVMQFIHLGRRTGTLLLTRGALRAVIGFHGGRLVSAQAPRTPKLGDLLISSGLIGLRTLDEAIQAQASGREHRSLGQLLVSSGAIDPEGLRKVIAQQIEQAVSEVMVWDTGTFEFAIDDLRPIDDIALYPSDVLPDADINTQMVLLEAARIFDERERNRGRGELPPEPPAGLPGFGEARRSGGHMLGGGHPAAGGHPPGAATGSAASLQYPVPLGASASAASAAAAEDDDVALVGPAGGLGAATATAAPPLSAVAAASGPAAGDSTHPVLTGAAVMDLDSTQDRAGRAFWESPKHAAERLHLQIVSTDEAFAEKLGEALRHEVAGVEGVSVSQAGSAGPGEPPPIVVVDLRAGGVTLEQAAALRRARPRASIVAVVDPGTSVAKVYAAGVLTALPPDVDAVAACVENVIESRDDLVRGSSGRAGGANPQSGVERLRRVFGDLRSGLISATVALNLMHIISESVERAVLFLVKRDHLVALGAFGADAQGRPLAELTRGIKLATNADGVFSRSLAVGEVQSVGFEDARLPDPFRTLVGRSRTGQVVVFPVLGAQRVISVIYTDNGDRDEPIEDIDILELATAQVGMAFENELLRRQISQNRDD